MFSALAVSAVILNSCSWDSPGANRYIGTAANAVNNYTDIPKPVRDILIKRMDSKKYDDIVEITRNSISGKNVYSDLRDMHFGKNQICKSVTREKWKTTALERALIYCEQGYCIAAPTVCGNISRISKKEDEEIIDPPTSAGSNSLGGRSFVEQSQEKIEFLPVSIQVPDYYPIIKKPETEATPGYPPHDLPPPYSPPPIYVTPPPIPEIPSWLMFIIGLAVIYRIKFIKRINK